MTNSEQFSDVIEELNLLIGIVLAKNGCDRTLIILEKRMKSDEKSYQKVNGI